jgi:hypothetical protein
MSLALVISYVASTMECGGLSYISRVRLCLIPLTLKFFFLLTCFGVCEEYESLSQEVKYCMYSTHVPSSGHYSHSRNTRNSTHGIRRKKRLTI